MDPRLSQAVLKEAERRKTLVEKILKDYLRKIEAQEEKQKTILIHPHVRRSHS